MHKARASSKTAQCLSAGRSVRTRYEPALKPLFTFTMASLMGAIRYVYPFLGYCSLIYLVIVVLNWFKVYSLTIRDPILIFGYISFLHVLSVPLLWWALGSRTQFYLVFIIMNTVWLLGVITMLILIHIGLSKYDNYG